MTTNEIYLVADYHFGHENLYKIGHFSMETSLRPDFSNSKEADEAMIERHNSVVKHNDRVYILGDVCFHKNHINSLKRLNGNKILIKGNHDTLPLRLYASSVEDVRAACTVRRIPNGKNILLTHIPIHPHEMYRWKLNVHGHTHTNVVMNSISNLPDPKYMCVCVEQNNYYPTHIDKVIERLEALS